MVSDFEGLALNTATVRQKWTLSESIDGCLRAGYTGISPSRMEVQTIGTRLASRLLRNSGLAVTGLNPSRVQPIDGSISARVVIDDLKLAIEQAAAIDARCLVVVAGGMSSGSGGIESHRLRFRDILGEIGQFAAAAGVRLGIEPLHPTFASDRSVVCDLTTAREIATELGAGAGIVVDVYHTWWDWRLGQELERAGELILGYHVNDWLVSSSDRLNDRGMMGDGVIDLRHISQCLVNSGYRGFIEVEIMSTRWWSENPDIVLQMAKKRINSILS